MSRPVKSLVGLALLSLQALPQSESSPTSTPCVPSGELELICNAAQPEDLAHIPDTSWVLVSGFSPGGGLKLLDTTRRHLHRWTGRQPGEIEFDTRRYPHCPGPPDGAALNLQGLSLRTMASDSHRLLASNHGGREAIEVFRVTARDGAVPRVTWIGCLPLPDGMPANSVSSFPDGTVLATVLTTPGHTMADYVLGRDSGVVLEWVPGASAFRSIPGTELPGNNGIEADADNRHFYVVAFGRHAIVGFERGPRARKVFEAVAPAFMPDNIHWDGKELIAAGMQYDEPACGGLRKVIAGVAETMNCHRGYTVSLLDPRTQTWRVVAYDVPNPGFNGVSTGLRIGNELWLGSYQSDRMAVRRLR
ncbi:MAG: hypothetical protein RL026_640 [Pseudomonadota bacterium]|jgi:hypothetical protein